MRSFLVSLLLVLSAPAFSASALDEDHHLYEFAIGKWQVAGGECLGGAPVNWGGEFKDFAMYFELKSDLRIELNLYKHQVWEGTSTGSFSVNDRNLYLRFSSHCRYSDGQTHCEGTVTPPQQPGLLMSVQGAQLWLLSNQGMLGGSCPAHDVFVMKLARRP
jgi:hypothetical protein